MRFVMALLLWLAFATASAAWSQEWSAAPWRDDLAQARQAFSTKYANIEWLEHDRAVPLAGLFDKASVALSSAGSDAAARAIFDRLIGRIGDGHVAIQWPRSAPQHPDGGGHAAAPPDVCDELGFDDRRSTAGTAVALPGYHALNASKPFPTGIVDVGAERVGVIRIGGFEPQGDPPLCRTILQARHRSGHEPCDDACRDAILGEADLRLTTALEERVRALRASGATVLLVDITNNGGGTEWSEAAARIVSPRPLTSEERGFVRGPHWSKQWRTLAARLRDATASASGRDRTRLLGWAADAERAATDADRPCRAEPCSRIGRAGYATGLVGAARAGEFAGKPWGDLVFSIARFPYHDRVWSGPLVVLVDDETWSAAEGFAAILQDNRAAAILGTRTGGAGCGHTDGGTPTVLKHSGAILELPDCIRFRRDGSNEVAGVIPDLPVGLRANDGPDFKAGLIAAHLLQAIDLARQRLSP